MVYETGQFLGYSPMEHLQRQRRMYYSTRGKSKSKSGNDFSPLVDMSISKKLSEKSIPLFSSKMTRCARKNIDAGNLDANCVSAAQKKNYIDIAYGDPQRIENPVWAEMIRNKYYPTGQLRDESKTRESGKGVLTFGKQPVISYKTVSILKKDRTAKPMPRTWKPKTAYDKISIEYVKRDIPPVPVRYAIEKGDVPGDEMPEETKKINPALLAAGAGLVAFFILNQ